jgi:hypothetical protein
VWLETYQVRSVEDCGLETLPHWIWLAWLNPTTQRHVVGLRMALYIFNWFGREGSEKKWYFACLLEVTAILCKGINMSSFGGLPL